MGFGDVASLVDGLVNEVDCLLDIHQQQASLRDEAGISRCLCMSLLMSHSQGRQQISFQTGAFTTKQDDRTAPEQNALRQDALAWGVQTIRLSSAQHLVEQQASAVCIARFATVNS